MHICFITEGRIFESAFGGIPTFLFSFSRWALSKGIDVTLVGSTFKGIKAERLSANATHDNIAAFESHRMSTPDLNPPYLVYMLSRFVFVVLWIAKIISIHRNSKFSIIHSQDTGYSGLAAAISGRILNIPVIVSAHGSRKESLQAVIGGKLRGLILRLEFRIEQLTIMLADNIFVANPVLKHYYNDRIKCQKTHLFPVPINLKQFSYSEKSRAEVRAELGIGDETVIGYIGRFAQEKNLASLVSAFGMIDKSKGYKLCLNSLWHRFNKMLETFL